MIGRAPQSCRLVSWMGATLALVVLGASPAGAVFLDPDNGVELRFRGYAQLSVATQDSQDLVTDPPKFVGQMMQNRYFMNPELEFNFLKWLDTDWFDELSMRFAAWGFYDGIYDYGPAGYNERLAESKFHADREGNPCPTCGYQTKARSNEEALAGEAKRRDGRWIYGRRVRLNEAYLNFAKGPLFVRLGRQAISWGEADTIGLLDANNPFDTTIVPGVFIDLDEARIPLWTGRATYKLFSNLGPFSSGFLDAYIVPGSLDVTVSPLQMQSVSPYSAPPPAQANAIEVAQIEPAWKFGNSCAGESVSRRSSRTSSRRASGSTRPSRPSRCPCCSGSHLRPAGWSPACRRAS